MIDEHALYSRLNRLLTLIEAESEDISAANEILKAIQKNEDAISLFLSHYSLYANDRKINYPAFLEDVQKISKLIGIEKQKSFFPLIVLLLERSEGVYIDSGFSHEKWIENLCDLCWKIRECKNWLGFTGIYSDTWYERWLFANAVTFHRLQFEIICSPLEYKSENFDINVGDTLINIHIPSNYRLPFNRENIEKSFDLAREYYRKKLNIKPIFHCSSWLIFNEHKNILPKESNIRIFTEMFEMGYCDYNKNFPHCSRIFNVLKPLQDPTEYEEKTSLQRAYKKFLIEGGIPGWQRGYRY